MISKYLNYSTKHDMIGAVLFFVAHLVLVTGLTTILVPFLGEIGFVVANLSTLIGTFFVLYLGGSILHHRGMTNDILSVIIVGLGLYLSFTSGVLIGLVPIALLTTIGKK